MKKLVTSLLFLAIVALAMAQVSTIPALIARDYAGEFTVLFDPTQGDGGMIGATTCYAHTGVITTKSKSDSDWKHAPTWGDNAAKYKMTKNADGLWELKITGGMKSYYNIGATEEITKLAFVFRDEKAEKQGKAAGGKDILYELVEPGKTAVKITKPADGNILEVGSSVDFVINVTNDAASCSLSVGKEEPLILAFTDREAKTSVTISSVGLCPVKVSVTHNDETVTDSICLYMANPEIHKPLPEGIEEGINYNPETQEVTLAFRAPFNESIYILGDFNDWEMNEDYHMYIADTLMKDPVITVTEKTRIFWRTFRLEDPSKKYGFVYKVDGDLLVSDPYATVCLDPWNDKYIKSLMDTKLPEYPSKIKDTFVSVLEVGEKPYDWKYDDFKIDSEKDLIIYELHVRDFTNSKTLTGVLTNLDYLKELGINAIELMPINEFDGNDSWGYNPNHFFAYDKAYGNKDRYKLFIDECHKRGIAVIVDMVFNHATGVCPFAKLYWAGDKTAANNPWFNQVARHPYNVYHDINHEYEGTRKYFRRVLKFWLDEYKIDGYRMDLVKGLSQRDCGESGQKKNWDTYDKTRIAILNDYYQAVKDADRDGIFILEHLGEYKEQKELSDNGMYPWRNMNNSYCQSLMGYASNSNFVDSNGKGGMFDNGFVGYGESHDEERNGYKANAYGVAAVKGKPEEYCKRVPMNMAFIALLPGPKMLWQFQEMGYDKSINMCQDGSIKDDCRTYAKPNIWGLKYDKVDYRQKAYSDAAKVIKLRTEHPEFFAYDNVKTTNCSSSTWKVRRLDVNYIDPDNGENDIDIVVMANFDPINSVMTSADLTHIGVWYDYMTGEEVNFKRVDKTINLEASSMKIYTSRRISEKPVGAQDVKSAGAVVSVSPTVTSDIVSVFSSEDVVAINVVDLSGKSVASVENEDEISLASLPHGMYLVNVHTVSGDSSTHRVIKE